MLSATRFTLVIPTFNRPWLFNGLLDYLASKRAAFQILVLDSSSATHKALNREAVGRYPLNIEWLGFDEDTDPVEKFCDGLSRVDTPYTALCADDDLIFVDAIEACVTELENHPAVIGCHGLYLNFSPDQRKVDVKIEYSARSIDSRTVLGRIFQLLAAYESLNYAVYRTECLVDVLQASKRVPNILFWELFACIGPLVSGQVTRLNCIYNARRARVAPIRPQGHPLIWLCENPDQFFTEFVRYRAQLLTFLRSKGLNPSDDMSTKITQAHIAYLANYTRDHGAFVKMIAGSIFAECPADSPLVWTASNQMVYRPAATSLFSRLVNALREAKRRNGIPQYCELQRVNRDVVVRLPMNELSRISREIAGDLSRYWAKVLEMDPLGAA